GAERGPRPLHDRLVDLRGRRALRHQRLRPRELLVERALPALERQRARQEHTVDEERRRARDAELTALARVRQHGPLVLLVVERGAEARQIEPQLPGRPLEALALEALAVLEQPG